MSNSLTPIDKNVTFNFTNTTTDQTYSIGSGAVNYTFPNPTIYTISSGVSCTDVTLSYTLVSAPSFVAFTPSLNTFTFNTSTDVDVGTFNVSYNATLVTGQIKTFNFSLVVSNPCLNATISASPLTNQTYMVNRSAVIDMFPAFPTNPIGCAVTYSLTN